MDRDATLRLSRYLRQETGARVRGVFHYDGDDYVVEFAREDVFPGYTTEEVEAGLEHLQKLNESRRAIQALYGQDRTRASVQVFEDLIEVHFPHGDGSGTVVTLESTSMEALQDFIGSCETVLQNGGADVPLQAAGEPEATGGGSLFDAFRS